MNRVRHLRRLVESRSREWPRFREGARKDERDWVKGLDDRQLVDLARGLGAVDRAVAKRLELAERPDEPSAFQPPRRDAA